MSTGLVMVLTGDGKGKTTSALGMAMRAVGHGMRVCFIQFIKGSWRYGELEAVKRYSDLLDFYVMGRGFTLKSKDLEKDTRAAAEAWKFAREVIFKGDYQMVILDEFTYILNYEMISMNEFMDVLGRKPRELHLVITGRQAPEQILKAADMITEMQAVKHHYRSGVKAQKGIEF